MSGFASYIDHTLLRPEATSVDHQKLFQEAYEYSFRAVCIYSSWLPQAREALRGSGVALCTVVGFPHGFSLSRAKAEEARFAIEEGADEIDMVLPIGLLKEGEDGRVLEDILLVRKATHGKILKVILETAVLSDQEIVRACELSVQAGADFVKTSTGFSPGGGASVHAVRLMKKTVGFRAQVKASGGIRDYQTAFQMIEAGATRLGTSSSVAILQGQVSLGGKGKNGDAY